MQWSCPMSAHQSVTVQYYIEMAEQIQLIFCTGATLGIPFLLLIIFVLEGNSVSLKIRVLPAENLRQTLD